MRLRYSATRFIEMWVNWANLHYETSEEFEESLLNEGIEVMEAWDRRDEILE